jgi:cardiolipin synthase
VAEPVLNVPNALTLVRILCVPLFLSLLVEGNYQLALVVFVVAGVTDGVDGAIARLTNSRTELGAHMDPAADKLLLVSSYITLAILGDIPVQLMIFVIVRDVVILGGFLLSGAVVGRYMEMAPSIWGKATTCLQLVSVVGVLATRGGWTPISPPALTVLFGLTALATIVSGVDYVLRGIRWYQAGAASSA